jgi:predicted HicB family RNase H-like nuclease
VGIKQSGKATHLHEAAEQGVSINRLVSAKLAM